MTNTTTKKGVPTVDDDSDFEVSAVDVVVFESTCFSVVGELPAPSSVTFVDCVFSCLSDPFWSSACAAGFPLGAGVVAAPSVLTGSEDC